MAIGASATIDFKNLDKLAKEAQKAFSDLNDRINDISSGLSDAANKAQSFNKLRELVTGITDAFDSLRKAMDKAFAPLKAAKMMMGGIFSIVRSIAMTPMNFAGGLVNGLKNAFTSMTDLAGDRVNSWWQAQKQRTSTGNLLALQRTEDTYGMNGMLSTLSETFASSLNDYSKYGGLLSSGISNDDISRYKNMDSTNALLDALAKIKENGIANGYNPNSRSYFDSTGMGEAFGISFEEYSKLIEVLPMVTKDLKMFKSAIATNDKIMLSTNRTSNMLGVAFDNLKTRLMSRFGPALLNLANTLTPVIDNLSKDLFTNENVKAFSDWLGKLTAQIKDFFKEGGMNKLKEWLRLFVDAIRATIRGFAGFASKFSDDPIWEEIKRSMNSPLQNLADDLSVAFKDMNAGKNTSSAGIRVSSGLRGQLSKVNAAGFSLGAENEAYIRNEMKSIRAENKKGVMGYIDVVGNKIIYIKTDSKGNTVLRKDLAEIKSDISNRTER